MLSFTMEEFERKLKLGLELKQKQTDSFIVATICRRNRKCYSLPSTFKAEARFRVKTKVSPEVTNDEQFLPHISGVKKFFLPRCWNS